MISSNTILSMSTRVEELGKGSLISKKMPMSTRSDHAEKRKEPLLLHTLMLVRAAAAARARASSRCRHSATHLLQQAKQPSYSYCSSAGAELNHNSYMCTPLCYSALARRSA